MKEPAQIILKPISISFILLGAVYAIPFIIGIRSITLALLNGSFVSEYNKAWLILDIIIALIGIFELIIGIIGFFKCRNNGKARFFIATGIVLCVFSPLSLVSGNVVVVLGNVLCPILYIIGGVKNKKAAAEDLKQE